MGFVETPCARSRPGFAGCWQSVPSTPIGRVFRRTVVVYFFALLGLSVLAPAARADDLLLLDGEQATLSGNLNYGFVYVDGELRLAGDTSITANSIYFGPHAYLLTCFVAGTGDNGCTAGRSLTLRANGPLTVAYGIDLTAGAGTVQPGGKLSLSGSPVTVGGNITTAGCGGAPSGRVSISSAGSLAIGAINAPGSSVTLGARGSIDVGDDIDTEGNNQIASSNPARVPSAGPVTVGSSAGDVRIDGDVNAYGRDAPTQGGARRRERGARHDHRLERPNRRDRRDRRGQRGVGRRRLVPDHAHRARLAQRARSARRQRPERRHRQPNSGANITLSAGGPLTAGGASTRRRAGRRAAGRRPRRSPSAAPP